MQLAAGAGASLKRAVISPVGNCFSAGVRGSCGAIRCCRAGPAPLLPGLGPCRARAGGCGSAGAMPGGQPPCRDLRRALPPHSPCFGGRDGLGSKPRASFPGNVSWKRFLGCRCRRFPALPARGALVPCPGWGQATKGVWSPAQGEPPGLGVSALLCSLGGPGGSLGSGGRIPPRGTGCGADSGSPSGTNPNTPCPRTPWGGGRADYPPGKKGRE